MTKDRPGSVQGQPSLMRAPVPTPEQVGTSQETKYTTPDQTQHGEKLIKAKTIVGFQA